jgi:hypothetical protein
MYSRFPVPNDHTLGRLARDGFALLGFLHFAGWLSLEICRWLHDFLVALRGVWIT